MKKHDKIFHFLPFLNTDMAQVFQSFLMEDKKLFMSCSQYYAYWWPGITISYGITSNIIVSIGLGRVQTIAWISDLLHINS